MNESVRCSMNYRYSHVIGFLSVSGRGFNNPVDLAVGNDGTLFVLNRAGSDVAERMVSKRITICTVEEDYFGEFAYGGSSARADDVALRHRDKRGRQVVRN